MNFCKSSVRSGSNRLLGLALGALAIAPAALVASLGNASAYPPNYVIEAECKDVGPATVCAENRRYGRWPRLTDSLSGIRPCVRPAERIQERSCKEPR